MSSKKPVIIAAACAFALGAALMSCDAQDAGDSSMSIDASTSASASTDSGSSSLGVRTDDDKVEVTIPEYYFEGNGYAGKSSKEIQKQLKSTFGSKVTKNDDGSWTVTMTRKDYEKFRDDLRSSVTSELDKMAGSDSFPNVQKVEYNDDLSKATITLTTKDLGTADMFDSLAVGIPACTYQQVAGKTVRCTVTTVSSDGTKLDKTVIPDDLEAGGKSDGRSLPDLSSSDVSVSDVARGVASNVKLPDVSSSDVEKGKDAVGSLVSTVMSNAQ